MDGQRFQSQATKYNSSNISRNLGNPMLQYLATFYASKFSTYDKMIPVFAFNSVFSYISFPSVNFPIFQASLPCFSCCHQTTTANAIQYRYMHRVYRHTILVHVYIYIPSVETSIYSCLINIHIYVFIPRKYLELHILGSSYHQ